MMKLLPTGLALATLSIATLAAPMVMAADSGTGITWDNGTAAPPPAAAPAPSTPGVKDANGITWNDAPPKTLSAPPPGYLSSVPPPANAGADNSGIVWNTPGAGKAPPAGAMAQGSMQPPPGTMSPGGAPRVAASGQCREFQTTIVIDGKNEPAHGTVCRQPDGSWRVVNN